ncbi:MAG: hypothetical protein VYA34_11125 [Myxococcota bacterium]|nr:hypothetical protein [Myxococcota bacterium]
MNEIQWFGERVSILKLSGVDRLDFLHRLTTNALKGLESGAAISTVVTTNQGKMLDWVEVVAQEDCALLISTACRAERVREWFEQFIIMDDVELEICSDAYAVFRVVGIDLSGAWHHELDQLSDCSVFQDDGRYGGGYLIFCPKTLEEYLRSKFIELELIELSLAERENLRVLMGVPSPNNEFESPVNPLELRLNGRSISFNKGCYIGQEVLSRLDAYDKLARVLIGFDGEREHLSEMEVGQKLYVDGKVIGKVTSVEPAAGAGLAIVYRDFSQDGNKVNSLRDGGVFYTLRDRPFWLS